MALNNFGVGVNFTGRDTGLSKTIDSVKSGFMGLASTVKNVATVSSQKMFQGFAQAPDVKTAVSDMHIAVTGIEAFGVAADQVTSKVFAGMGNMTMSTAKAKSMIGSLAYGMNRDVGTLANSFKSLQQNGIDVTKIGFSGFKQFAKFADVADLNTQDFAAAMSHLKNEVGFSDDEIKKLVQTTANVGVKFNMGTEAMNGMVQMTKLMQEEGAGLFKEWGPAKTKQFLESGTALAGMFMQAGHSAQEAQQLAQGLTKTVMAGKNSFNEIYSGLNANLSEFGMNLSENFTGGVEEAFQMLQDSPLDFAKKLNETFQKVKKVIPADKLTEATARFSMQLSKVAGPAVADFITHGMDPMSKQAAELSKQLGAGGLAGNKGIGAVSNGFRTGLNAADDYNRILDQFSFSLKKLAGVNDGAFNKSLRESTHEMGSNIQAMKGEYKGIGKFFDAVVEINNHGFGAYLGHLDKSFLATQALTKQLGPVAGGIINLGLMFHKAGKDGNSFANTFGPMKEKLKEFGKGAGEFIKDMIAGFKILWPQIADGASGALIALNEALTGDKAGTATDAIKNIFNRGIAYLTSPQFKKSIETAWEGFKGMLVTLYNKLGGDETQVSSLGQALTRIWERTKPYIMSFMSGLLADVLHLVARSAGKIWETLVDTMTPDLIRYGSFTKAKGSTLSSSEDYSRDTARTYTAGVSKPTMEMGPQPLVAAPPGVSNATTKPSQAQSANTKALSDAIHNPAWVTAVQQTLDSQTGTLQQGFRDVVNALSAGRGGGGNGGRTTSSLPLNQTGVGGL